MLNFPCAADANDSQKEETMKKEKLTILYERLSVEDDRDTESNSILKEILPQGSHLRACIFNSSLPCLSGVSPSDTVTYRTP